MTHDDAPQLGPELDPPFDEDDLELVVNPLRRVTYALAGAICDTIDYARAGDSIRRPSVIEGWRALGDEIVRFMKVVDA